jgi:hypothetical protein
MPNTKPEQRPVSKDLQVIEHFQKTGLKQPFSFLTLDNEIVLKTFREGIGIVKQLS